MNKIYKIERLDYWYTIVCRIPHDMILLASELQEYHLEPRIVAGKPAIECIVFDWQRDDFERVINQYERGLL